LEKAGNSFYQTYYGRERVYVMAGWNFYDLKNQELLFFYLHKDSVDWTQYVTSLKQAIAKLPPRREAVFASAEITGENFAEYLVPHWIEVERMYYTSGHVELNKTEQLVQRNEWMEAAKIWKNNVNNKNKSIAAKSMFNLALACEISGDMDAAIDWAVKSYHVFGNKNEVHAANCKNYIDILGMRKKDIKQIESTDNSE
jgi:hypothetical protein